MKPEQQRIAIAEACGWDCDPIEARDWGSRGQWARKVGDSERNLASLRMAVPKYVEDLNAMHEAEKVLDDRQYCIFEERLYDLVGETLPLSDMKTVNGQSLGIMAPSGYIRAVSATAAQRAEAFLKTIGKWEESP